MDEMRQGKERKRDGFRHTLIGLALWKSSRGMKALIALLALVSFFCSASNVLIPVLQKQILTAINQLSPVDHGVQIALLYGAIAFSFLTLLAQNVINIFLLYRFRHRLERECFRVIAKKDVPLIGLKGPGAYATSVTGDCAQIAAVVFANWFAVLFNVLGAIASIVISAIWSLTFLLIAGFSYLLILLAVFLFNHLSVKAFKKAQDESYFLGPKLLEMVDDRDAIMGYQNIVEYEGRLEPSFALRDRYAARSDRYAMYLEASVSFIQALAVASLILYANASLTDPSVSSAWWNLDKSNPIDGATLLALITYFSTVFAPVSSLSKSYLNARKFRAFYERVKDVIDVDFHYVLPSDNRLAFSSLSYEENGGTLLDEVSFAIDGRLGIVGLSGEGSEAFLNLLKGRALPSKGKLLLGGESVHAAQKSLLLSLIRFSPEASDIFREPLEYNLTLGAKIVEDEEYAHRMGEYLSDLSRFLDEAERGRLFVRRNKALTRFFLREILSLTPEDYAGAFERQELSDFFKRVWQKERFLKTIGVSLFSKRYVRKSRYEKIVRDFGLERLKGRDFGPRGEYLSESDKYLLMLGRFLLPENDNPYVLIDPLARVHSEARNVCLNALHRFVSEHEGIIITNNLNTMRYLSDEVLFFENGRLKARKTHANLLKSDGRYRALWEEEGKHASKIKRNKKKSGDA